MKKIILTFILLFVSFGASAEWAVNLQQPITEVGESIYNLHLVITFICVIIFIGVFGFMFYSIYYHRKSRGHKASQFHENTTVEVIWTIIPFVILIAMAWPATKTLLIMRDTSAPDMTIKATGYQWKWGYEYLDHDVQFYSTLTTPKNQITNVEEKNTNYLLEVDNHVVVPVGKKSSRSYYCE
jgi:cytochrome c oxidase subunit 2